MNRHRWSPVSLGLLLSLVSCRQRSMELEQGSRASEVRGNSSYDTYVTWQNYDGYHSPENAVYVYGGRELGRGDEGFSRVLDALRELPPGSRVLVYPMGYFCLFGLSAPRDESYYVPPCNERLNELHKVAQEHNLVLIRSNHGQNGELAWPKPGLIYEHGVLR